MDGPHARVAQQDRPEDVVHHVSVAHGPLRPAALPVRRRAAGDHGVALAPVNSPNAHHHVHGPLGQRGVAPRRLHLLQGPAEAPGRQPARGREAVADVAPADLAVVQQVLHGHAVVPARPHEGQPRPVTYEKSPSTPSVAATMPSRAQKTGKSCAEYIRALRRHLRTSSSTLASACGACGCQDSGGILGERT